MFCYMARPTGSSSQFKVTSSIAVESKKFFFLISIGFYLFFYSWIYDDHRHCIDSSMSPDCLIIFIPWHALIRFVACVSTIMTLWGVPHSPGLSLSFIHTRTIQTISALTLCYCADFVSIQDSAYYTVALLFHNIIG